MIATAGDHLRDRTATGLIGEFRDRFAPDRARGIQAVVEFRVGTGEGEAERFQLVIDDGRCGFAERAAQPSATIAIGLEDLAALLEGRAKAMSLFMSQRLRVWGDVLLAVRLPHLFSA